MMAQAYGDIYSIAEASIKLKVGPATKRTGPYIAAYVVLKAELIEIIVNLGKYVTDFMSIAIEFRYLNKVKWLAPSFLGAVVNEDCVKLTPALPMSRPRMGCGNVWISPQSIQPFIALHSDAKILFGEAELISTPDEDELSKMFVLK